MRRICDKFEKKMTKGFHMHRMNRREENVRCYSRLHRLEGKGLSYAINERKKIKKNNFISYAFNYSPGIKLVEKTRTVTPWCTAQVP